MVCGFINYSYIYKVCVCPALHKGSTIWHFKYGNVIKKASISTHNHHIINTRLNVILRMSVWGDEINTPRHTGGILVF